MLIWPNICDDDTLIQILCFWTLSIAQFLSKTMDNVRKYNICKNEYWINNYIPTQNEWRTKQLINYLITGLFN
jgi:hypothetical protein